MTNPIRVACSDDLKFLQPKLVKDLARVGNSSDGGYAMTSNSLLNPEYFLSLGLGENWSFESAVSKINPNSSIDIYDDTVSLIFFTTKALKGLIKFLLLRDSLANLSSRYLRLRNYIQFWLQSSKNRHHKIHINEQTFREILRSYSEESRIGLKVDIEGSEWEILKLISENQFRFEFILIEIHDFDYHEHELRVFLNSLKDDFVNAHLHANNFEPLGSNGFPRVFELTLLRKSSAVILDEARKELPISGLDVPNAKNRPDFELTFN
ncbi:Methyltransferase FkbM [Candidatus Nanopelagicaceae bacterium]